MTASRPRSGVGSSTTGTPPLRSDDEAPVSTSDGLPEPRGSGGPPATRRPAASARRPADRPPLVRGVRARHGFSTRADRLGRRVEGRVFGPHHDLRDDTAILAPDPACHERIVEGLAKEVAIWPCDSAPRDVDGGAGTTDDAISAAIAQEADLRAVPW